MRLRTSVWELHLVEEIVLLLSCLQDLLSGGGYALSWCHIRLQLSSDSTKLRFIEEFSKKTGLSLLSYTETPKDLTQDVIRGNLTGYAADMVQGLAQVRGEQIGAQPGIQAFANALQGFSGSTKFLVMAQVGQYDGVPVQIRPDFGY